MQPISCFSKVIEMNRRAAEHQAQNLLKELEEEIRELRQRSTTLSQLALSEDYVHFLKVQTKLVLPLCRHSYVVLIETRGFDELAKSPKGWSSTSL